MMVLVDQPRSTAGSVSLAPPARTLVEVFAATVAQFPHPLALEAPDGSLTYEQLASRVASVARKLTRTGIGPGERVGVRIPSGTAELYIAILGIIHAGAAYVPVDADDPDARAEQIWEDSAAAAVVGIALGRYLDGKLDAEGFAPVPSLGSGRAYRTGDFVRQGPGGLEFVGRRDGLVKIGGRKVRAPRGARSPERSSGHTRCCRRGTTRRIKVPVLVPYVVARQRLGFTDHQRLPEAHGDQGRARCVV